jgi:hypothetical protein
MLWYFSSRIPVADPTTQPELKNLNLKVLGDLTRGLLWFELLSHFHLHYYSENEPVNGLM